MENSCPWASLPSWFFAAQLEVRGLLLEQLLARVALAQACFSRFAESIELLLQQRRAQPQQVK